MSLPVLSLGYGGPLVPLELFFYLWIPTLLSQDPELRS